VKQPQRNPAALVIGVATVALIYVGDERIYLYALDLNSIATGENTNPHVPRRKHCSAPPALAPL